MIDNPTTERAPTNRNGIGTLARSVDRIVVKTGRAGNPATCRFCGQGRLVWQGKPKRFGGTGAYLVDANGVRHSCNPSALGAALAATPPTPTPAPSAPSAFGAPPTQPSSNASAVIHDVDDDATTDDDPSEVSAEPTMPVSAPVAPTIIDLVTRLQSELVSRADVDAIRSDMTALTDSLAELEARIVVGASALATGARPSVSVSTASAPIATIPKLDPTYLVDQCQLEAIKRIIALADAGEPQNIGLYGLAGTGKTTMGLQIGALRRAPTFVEEAAGKETATDWYHETYGVDRESGLVMTRESQFVRGIETPNAVVVLNDVALLQSRTVQNGLNELLDPSTRQTYVPALARVVKVARGVVIIGTWNVGAQFTGASELSEQLLDRFRAGALFEVGALTNGALTDVLVARTGIGKRNASKLTAMVDWLRADAMPINVSTRALISAARHVANGATLGHAIYYTALGDLDAGERARAYSIIDVNLRSATDADREEWSTPINGNYVAWGS